MFGWLSEILNSFAGVSIIFEVSSGFRVDQPTDCFSKSKVLYNPKLLLLQFRGQKVANFSGQIAVTFGCSSVLLKAMTGVKIFFLKQSSSAE